MGEAERLEELLNRYPDLEEMWKHPKDRAELMSLIWRPSAEPVPAREGSSAREPAILPTKEIHDAEFDPLEVTLHRAIGKLDVCSYIGSEDGWEYLSPAFARLTGYTPEEITGWGQAGFLRLFPTDHKPGIVRLARALILGKPPTELAMGGILRKDGSVVFILGSTLATKHNGRTALVGVCFDVTKRVRAEARLRQAMEGAIHAMALTVETRDPYTAGHQRRVADLASAIAEGIGIHQEAIQGIKMSAVIHDLGKLRVPPDILSNPGRLTEPEFAIIKTHPRVAYDILSAIEFPWPVSKIVYQHHERIDGSGYPQGLQKDEILIEARIIGVADVVEAMASHRPYRPALGIDRALEEIQLGAGTRYDPDVASVCVDLFESKGYSLLDTRGSSSQSAYPK